MPLKELVYPLGIEDDIRGRLGAGEVLIAICDWGYLNPDEIMVNLLPINYRTFAITSGNLREFGHSKGPNKSFSISTAFGSSIPLAHINNVRYEARGSRVGLTVEVNGRDPLHLHSKYAKAIKFASRLQEVVASVGAPASSGGMAQELERLAELTRVGSLTEEEWTRAKEVFLGRPKDERVQMLGTLRSLHDLHEQGVLSEGEFNMKKWEILSRSSL